ncbi:MAG: hypothetical protein ACOCRX_00920 [Candidatus Woesearchaeota archaeon]
MKTYQNSKKYDFTNVTTEVDIYKMLLNDEITRFPKYFWHCEDSNIYAPKIIKYLIEDVLEWDSNDIKKKLRKKTFEDNKLRGMLYHKYDDSPYKAIFAAYPDRNYKSWDFVNTPNNYWQGEQGRKNAIKATKWLIEEKLKWDMKDIKEKINYKIFVEHNLLGMLKRVFDTSIYKAIDSAYPGVFKRWELGEHVRNNFWTIEEGKLATKWLIEEKLKWNDEMIRKKLNKQVFIDNDLYGMLQRCFNASPYLAINSIYPNKFKQWELPYVTLGFWNEENCTKAFKWLVEDKLKIKNKDNIKKYISKEILMQNGMCIPYEKYGVKRLIKEYLNN